MKTNWQNIRKRLLIIASFIFIIIVLLFTIPWKLDLNNNEFIKFYNIKSYASNNVLLKEGKFYTKVSAKYFHKNFLELESCIIDIEYGGLLKEAEITSVFGEEKIEFTDNSYISEGFYIEYLNTANFELTKSDYKIKCSGRTTLISYIVSRLQK